MTATNRRAVITIADQVFSSGSNFVVGVAVARLAGPRGYGGYILAYTLWLIAAGIHRALITQPLVIRVGNGEDRPRLTRRGLAAEVLLGLAMTAVMAGIGGGLMAMGAHNLGAPILYLAPWIVFLLLQDYWRWMAFLIAKPGKALNNDLLFAVVQVGILGAVGLAHHASTGVAIGSWGAGALAGTLVGFLQFDIGYERQGWNFVAESWHLGKWLAGDFATTYGSGQVYLLVVAGELGTVDLGALKAAAGLMGPTHILLFAGDNFGLPEAMRVLSERGRRGLFSFALLLSLAITVGVGLYSAPIIIWGGPMMTAVYGPKFAGYGTVAALTAVQYWVSATVFGPSTALKATELTRRLFGVRLVSTVISLAVTVVLATAYGIEGAAWGGVVTAVAGAVGLWWVWARSLGRGGEGPSGLRSVSPPDEPEFAAAFVSDPAMSADVSVNADVQVRSTLPRASSQADLKDHND